MPEPGATEGQAPKLSGEPFPRQTGRDLPPFSEASKTPEALAKEAYEKGNLESFVENASEITAPLTPEAQQLAENVRSMRGAIDVVEGFGKFAIGTGDSKTVKLLIENGTKIVNNLTANPDKVSETVEAWTEEEAQSFTKALEDKGIINKNQPPSATEPPATSAK